LIKTCDIDGFGSDLAKLLGGDFLNIVQKRLKKCKKSIIFVAEPWSFRGNIGIFIPRFPYSICNDEYREFIKNYVIGNGNPEGLKIFYVEA
jgi:hypothetical protein